MKNGFKYTFAEYRNRRWRRICSSNIPLFAAFSISIAVFSKSSRLQVLNLVQLNMLYFVGRCSSSRKHHGAGLTRLTFRPAFSTAGSTVRLDRATSTRKGSRFRFLGWIRGCVLATVVNGWMEKVSRILYSVVVFRELESGLLSKAVCKNWVWCRV